MAVETALDWFRRSSKKRRRHRHSKSGPNNDDVDDDDESLNANITTATDAAWTFLRYGRSGIAPIDAAWKRCRNDERQRQRHRPKDRYQPWHEQNCLPPPPVVVLEGPRDVGKTWMLLTLAARYVVETRASKFDNVVGNKDVDTDDTDGTENNNEESDNNNKSEISRPKVLLLDSSYDFSISQLVYVVQQRLRLVHQQQHQETISANDNVDNHDGHNGEQQQEQQQHQQQQHKSLEQRQLEEELERQEKGRLSFEKDMEDCLSRIHIIQVDDGSTWVPMLEALTHQLSDDNRRNGNSNSTSTSNDNLPRETDPSFSSSSAAPILLLWDGFLSDLIVANSTMTTSAGGGSNIIMSNNSSNNNNAYQNTLFDSPGSRELLRQVSRLLEKQRDTLWWVLTTRTSSSSTTATATTTAKNAPFTSSIENYGIGFRVAEWIRKEEERRELQQQKEQERQQHQLQPPNNHTGFVPRRQLHQNHDQKQPQRKTYRVRLDRRSSISSSSRSITTMGMATLFARVITSRSSSIASNEYNNRTNNYINDVDGGENIPYSLSLEGILS